MDRYYHILHINPGASEKEIKTAYRQLARKYHPDRNPAGDAQEKFIEITEAYEILMNKDKKLAPVVFETGYDQVNVEDQRRQRAAEYARMRYEAFKRNNEAFKRSWYFPYVKTGVALLVFSGYIMAGIFFLSPLIGWMFWGSKTLLITIVMFMFSAHIYRFSRDLQKESKKYW